VRPRFMDGHYGGWDSEEIEGNDFHSAIQASMINMPKPNPPRLVTQEEVRKAYWKWATSYQPPLPPPTVTPPTVTPPPGTPVRSRKPFKKKKADR
jgi:hypothetical protein